MKIEAEVGNISDALIILGLPVNEDTIAQMQVCARAMEKYVEREIEYGQTWKQFDAGDAAHHCVHKASRMQSTIRRPVDVRRVADPDTERLILDAAVDSALDNIVYSGFYLRHLEGTK